MTKLALDTENRVVIPCADIQLEGLLYIPSNANGIVLFAHGSGSSRLSQRNQFVAQVLNEANLATLLFDLLTSVEEELDDKTSEFRFDIDFLATRLISAASWIKKLPMTQNLAMGYLGASTGGGAALVAAANHPESVKAVISRGGRPDLAEAMLPQVQAPVLLIVGGKDSVVIEMNKSAMGKLNTIKKMEIIPGATHLFEEPGALNEVASLAKDWFSKYLFEAK